MINEGGPVDLPGIRARGADESRLLLESLIDTMAAGLVLQSPDGAIRRANSAAERILGLTIHQMQGRKSIDAAWRALREDLSDFPGEEHPAMVAIRTGAPVRGVVMGVFNPARSSHSWILIDAAPIVLSDGTWAISTFTDITALRAAEHSRSSILRALDEHAIVSMTDTEGTITYANDAFCVIAGYRREELLGSNHRILRSGRHPAEFYQDMWATISSGRVWRGEICNIRKNGTYYWVLATISPMFDAAGTIDGYIAIRTDITDQKDAEQSAEARARIDPLTGCANRRGFDDYLNTLWHRPEAAGQPVALVMLDIDHFKAYNDAAGHPAGDRVLSRFAQVLDEATTEHKGYLARWGGEEFAVVLPGLDADRAAQVAESMVARIRACGIPRPEPEATGPITISAGVAVAVPGSRSTPAELTYQADRMLYLAKQRGRDQAVGPEPA